MFYEGLLGAFFLRLPFALRVVFQDHKKSFFQKDQLPLYETVFETTAGKEGDVQVRKVGRLQYRGRFY